MTKKHTYHRFASPCRRQAGAPAVTPRILTLAIGLVLGTISTVGSAAQRDFTSPFQPDEAVGAALSSLAVGTADSRDTDVTADGDDRRPDRDDDGIANQDDLDDDNDSILDTEEGIIDANGDGFADATSRDTDGDGTPDGNDLDSDNDGILDLIEGRLDEDLRLVLDSDNNGAIDVFHNGDSNGTLDLSEGHPSSDDILDLIEGHPGSDGILDLIEGHLGEDFLLVLDSINSGANVGSNGILDMIESSADSGSINFPLFDTDDDGVPDYIDSDSDGDGIFDLVEAGALDVDGDGRIDGFVDLDTKGVDDAIQANALPRFDTDADGLRDYRDTDSDDDGIPDSVENTGSASEPVDTDGDGAADYREQDSDNDGVNDATEVGPDVTSPVDSNGDGIADFQDASVQFTGNGEADPEPIPVTDHDGDGEPNSQDFDDDNDGISDTVEGDSDSDSDGVVDRLDLDSDNDGIPDSVELGEDSDGDGVPDYLDLDSDNDGQFDALEAGHTAISFTGRLGSSASVDEFGLAEGASEHVLNSDGDGVADPLDLDSDNDGLPDLHEGRFADVDLDARLDDVVDENGDGADDSRLPGSSALLDSDADRIANARDLDSDQDSLSDLFENSGSDDDLDNNGQVDDFLDANRDGLDDNVAAHLTAPTDTDNDGIPNFLDPDSDGDGISDLVESGGQDGDNDGRNDLLSDSDGDGIPDSNDVDFTGGDDADNDGIDDAVDVDFVTGPDSDGDGVVDPLDPDVDGNGFAGPFDDDGDGQSQGEPVDLPDDDGDGVPDLQQGQALSGMVETGLGGSGLGCSIATVGSHSRFDPLLPLLLGGSALMLLIRIRRRSKAGSES